MGDPDDLPKVKPGEEKIMHNPQIGTALGLYAFVQLSLSVVFLDHFLNIQSESSISEDKYSFSTGSVWIVWIFWSLWSISEVVEGRIRALEIVRTLLTGLVMIDPIMPDGDRVRLPELLSIPFLASALWAITLRLTSSTKAKTS